MSGGGEMVRRMLEEALAAHQAGRLAEADVLYRRVLAGEPGNADALHLLGVLAHQAGSSAVGLQLINKAIALVPAVSDFHHHRAQVLLAMGRASEALEAADCAVAIGSGSGDAHRARGDALGAMGRHADAISAFERALAIDANDRDALAHMGISLLLSERVDEAVKALSRAVALGPDADAWLNLGVAQHKVGRLDEAVESFRRVLDSDEGNEAALGNLGMALWGLNRVEEAIAVFDRLLQVNPKRADVLARSGVLLATRDRLSEAMERFKGALEIEPKNGEFVTNVGGVYQKRGRVDESLHAYRWAIALDEGQVAARDNLLLTLHYSEAGKREIFEEHVKWGDWFAKVHGRDAHVTWGRRRERLRVGYLSADFRKHSVGFFMQPVMARHDRSQVEVFCYSDAGAGDEVTEEFRGLAEHWVQINGWSDPRVAERVRADGVDVLIDLAGHTAGNRLGMFSRRAASVQVTYLGYPNTTGLAEMDWRISDNFADPASADSDQLNTEKLWRMKRSAWCYRAPAGSPEVSQSPMRDSGYATFGSFNALAKISQRTIAAWAEILRRVERSRLLLKAQALSDEQTRRYWIERLEAGGVDVCRVELRGGERSHADHMELYGRVDMALDTFPYAGTTTTCEAMWMGVPVVTLRGEAHVGRVGVSLLSNVGLAELVAESVEEYVEKAVGLARDADRLAELRCGMRDRMRASPLMDEIGFVRELEEAYLGMCHAGRRDDTR